MNMCLRDIFTQSSQSPQRSLKKDIFPKINFKISVSVFSVALWLIKNMRLSVRLNHIGIIN